MAEEHILLARDRYQRLLNKTNGSTDTQKKEKNDEKEKPDKRRRNGPIARKGTPNSTKKTENGEDVKAKKKIIPSKKREERPPGIPALNVKNWIRY